MGPYSQHSIFFVTYESAQQAIGPILKLKRKRSVVNTLPDVLIMVAIAKYVAGLLSNNNCTNLPQNLFNKP
jgi:hypothetical protein